MHSTLVARLLAYVTGMVNQQLLLQNEYLLTENRILRAHLPSRLLLTDPERSTLAVIGKRLGRQGLQPVATAAKTRHHPRLVPEARRSQVRRLPPPPPGLRDHSDQSTVVIDHRDASHLMLLHRIQGGLQIVVRATRQWLPRHYILYFCAAGIAVFGDDL
jgi:hypothetical protein